MNGEIYLDGCGFSAALELFEENLTKARDTLLLIDDKGRSLSRSWEGEAEKVWALFLKEDLSGALHALSGIQTFSAKLVKAAGKLADTKKKASFLIGEFVPDLM